ncbi:MULTISPECIES: transposase, partial [unclassified Pseudomonas]|uniref:transposase n=1 Tax=unclassified Pseudomonas TaxID=196821 RepID=UPI0020064C14
MSQMSFSDFEYAGKRKQTRRERFLAEMDQVVPWSAFLKLIEPYWRRCRIGLVHHVHGTVADVTQVAELLHGEENAVYADAGYTGVEQRKEHENRKVIWQIAARRSTYSKLNKRSLLYKAKRKIEYCKAQTRAKV